MRAGQPASTTRVHVVQAPIRGGVLDHVLDLVRFDPMGAPEVVLPPWPGLDRAAARFAAVGARVHRLAPASKDAGLASWLGVAEALGAAGRLVALGDEPGLAAALAAALAEPHDPEPGRARVRAWFDARRLAVRVADRHAAALGAQSTSKRTP